MENDEESERSSLLEMSDQQDLTILGWDVTCSCITLSEMSGYYKTGSDHFMMISFDEWSGDLQTLYQQC